MSELRVLFPKLIPITLPWLEIAAPLNPPGVLTFKARATYSGNVESATTLAGKDFI